MSKLNLAASVVQIVALAVIVYGVYLVSLTAAVILGGLFLFIVAEAAGKAGRS